jgi:hypothetical protein
MSHFVQELEALLTAYLSQHWHKMTKVMEANELDLRADGLVCLVGSKRGQMGLSRDVSGASLHGEQSSESLTGLVATPSGALDSVDTDSSLRAVSVSAPGRSQGSNSSHGRGTRAWRRARHNWHRAFQVITLSTRNFCKWEMKHFLCSHCETPPAGPCNGSVLKEQQQGTRPSGSQTFCYAKSLQLICKPATLLHDCVPQFKN